jgi:high-affinity iron transporter
MAAQSVQFLNNAGFAEVLGRTVWDTSWILSEGSLFGRLLHTLIGYTERPTELQLTVYIGTLFVMGLLMRLARNSPRQRVAA